jgi:ribosome biogenesis GTPase
LKFQDELGILILGFSWGLVLIWIWDFEIHPISTSGDIKLELEELGWDEHFQIQVDSLGLEGIIPGRVFRISPSGYCEIYSVIGEITARVSGRMKNQATTGADLPAVGDWVLFKPVNMGNMIFKVLTRKNQISRKTAGRKVKEQVVAANIDIMFLERFIFMVTASQSTPVVILNKADLVLDVSKKEKKVRSIVGDEVDVHSISALKKNRIASIQQYLGTGVTIALVGSSGVGKSTIINALLGEAKQKTADVRVKDGKGRHVTKSRELFLIPGGGVMIDNPGIREIQLWGDPIALQGTFKDIEELSKNCRFSDCAHLSEPGCAVTIAIESGYLSKKRYENYQKMRKEMAHLTQKMEMSAEALEKSKWKGIMKNAKHYRRYKKNRD